VITSPELLAATLTGSGAPAGTRIEPDPVGGGPGR